MKQYFLKFTAWSAELIQLIKDFFTDSIAWLRLSAIKLKDLVKTNYELGVLHLDNGNIFDAKIRLMLVLKFRPDFALAHYHLARCHLFNLTSDLAEQELETALALDPNLIAAQYRLKLIKHTVLNGPISTQVAREDYNALANQYENYAIKQLNYDAPELLAEAIARQFENNKSDAERTFKALDLGCGTGLVGAYLAQRVTITSQTGLDISEKMLSLAKALEINNCVVYAETKECDFHNLEVVTDKFDIITACMSFSYANDLSAIFTKIANITLEETILGLVVLKSSLEPIEFNYDYACFSFSEKFLQDIFKKFNWLVVEQKEITLFVDGSIGLMFILKQINQK